MEQGTQRIETSRLILRRFVFSDAENMYRNWARDPAVTEFLSWSPHKNVNETKKILRKLRREYHNKNFYQWAIELKEIGQVVGMIAVIKENINWHNGKKAVIEKELFYCLGRNWQGKGIMTEATIAVIDYLFGNTDTTRITAKHNTENPASGSVMRKAGMQYEGTLRQYSTSNHGIEDICVYSILRANSCLTNKTTGDKDDTKAC